jgi:hypothetical protein
MIEELRRELAASGPLAIKEAAFADPALTLAGEGWSLSTPSAWRVLKAGVLEFGWSSAEVSDLIWELCGVSIVSVAPQSLRIGGDPAFELSDGRWLERLFRSDAWPEIEETIEDVDVEDLDHGRVIPNMGRPTSEERGSHSYDLARQG